MDVIPKSRLFFHIFALIINLILFFSYFQVPMGSRSFIQKFFYLTNWNEILIILYYLSAIIEDIKSYISNKHRTSNMNMISYRSIIPLSLLISLSYWTILYFNSSLLRGKKIDLKVPLYLDIWMHFGNFFLFVFEVLIVKEKKREFKSSEKVSLITNSIALFYILALLVHLFIYDRHVYPFLNVLSWKNFSFVCCIFLLIINLLKFGLEKIVDYLTVEKEHEA